MSKKIRLRFAPSPTGFLHVGSLRTVLFNYFIAKSLKGKLILRIEDTDQKREVKGAIKGLIKILDWLGIEFDEGPHIGGTHKPYIQTERLDIYQKYIDRLIQKGSVYRCFCAEERLEKLRKDLRAKKMPPRYDRKCRELSEKEIRNNLESGKKYVIRQKMPLSGIVSAKDELRGEIKFNAEDLEDHVLIKSNGVPTYQFASVVDDHLMEISHVVRGDEWLPSFPKNVLLYQDFGWDLPKFIHMPLTLNKEGGKLSKRQGDVAVEDYKKKGYLQEALINFSALLGWHPKDDNEILSLNEIVKKFKIKDIGTSPAVFDIEKLDYFNGYYIRKKKLEELTKLCIPHLIREGYIKKEDDRFKNKKTNKELRLDFIKNITRLAQERMKKLSEIGELSDFFFVDKIVYEPDLLIWKKTNREDVRLNLDKIIEIVAKIPEESWTNDSIEDALISYIKGVEGKVGEYLWPMRVALTGKKASPGPFDVAEVLGKEETLIRIKNAKML